MIIVEGVIPITGLSFHIQLGLVGCIQLNVEFKKKYFIDFTVRSVGQFL